MCHHLFSQMPHYHAQVRGRAGSSLGLGCGHGSQAAGRPSVADARARRRPTLTPMPASPRAGPATQEATQAIKQVLGDYYKVDNRPLLSALWTDLRLCRYVAPDAPGSGIFWFRK